jgi:hypothetical protein
MQLRQLCRLGKDIYCGYCDAQLVSLGPRRANCFFGSHEATRTPTDRSMFPHRWNPAESDRDHDGRSPESSAARILGGTKGVLYNAADNAK